MVPTRRRKITQKEVARLANVSQTLVSLVLNDSPVDITEATRRQILDAARNLGYSIKRRRTVARIPKVLAYIRPTVRRIYHEEHWIYDSYDEYFDRIQNYLLEAAFKEGYSLIVRPYSKPAELTRWLKESEVDGVVWHGEGGEMAAWIAERYPMIQLFRQPVVEADTVSSDQEKTVTLPMDYLRERGHRKILFLAGFPSNEERGRLRNKIYRNYLETHQLPCFRPEIAEEIDRAERNLQAIAGILASALRSQDAPTAVVTGDHYALYAMKYLAEEKFHLPRELSFIGIDNVTASSYSHPALTSVDNRLDEIADTAISVLLWRLHNRQAAIRSVYITPRLVERQSVADLRGQGAFSPRLT